MLNNSFEGVKKLLGHQQFSKVQNAHIAIVGLGGVGSWVCDALARCGVSQITLIDLDDICVSNINRQILANHHTIGKQKTEVMAQMINMINPQCRVNIIEDFFTESTKEFFFRKPYDVVVDCIDSVSHKALLISECKVREISVVTVGGTSGKIDPTQIQITDLNRSFNDPLLMRVRKKLKRDYGFSRDKRSRYAVTCVFSPEPMAETEISEQEQTIRRFSCQSGPGTIVTVCASFGLFAAQAALNYLKNHSSEE